MTGYPRIVSIVNVTPDSFSDGGVAFTPQLALRAIERHIAQGADIIDIGAESTRPGATALTAEDEWERLKPVLPQAIREFARHAAISLDTRHAASARRALELGVDWINDVCGFGSHDMIDAVAGSSCKLVMMHSLGVPADKTNVLTDTTDVVATLSLFVKQRLRVLLERGIARERVIFDPGIGFGKTPAQSLMIVRRIAEVKSSAELPILIGHSRKSFLAGLTRLPGERDDATLAVSQFLCAHAVDFLRVHDTARHRCMLDVMEALHA